MFFLERKCVFVSTILTIKIYGKDIFVHLLVTIGSRTGVLYSFLFGLPKIKHGPLKHLKLLENPLLGHNGANTDFTNIHLLKIG